MVDGDQGGPPAGAVLITAAGTAAGYGIARTLRERWDDAVTIVAADTNPPELVAVTPLADVTVQVGGWREPGYPAAIAQLVADHDVCAWWPILDGEVAAAAAWQADGHIPASVAVMGPPRWAAELCLDKLALARWLSEHGLPTPPTVPLGEAAWTPAGVVVKPRSGHGSHGIHVCRMPDELRALVTSLGDDHVAQQRCRAPELTVDGFRSRDGTLVDAVVRERLDVKAGVTVKGRLFTDPDVTALTARLASGLELTGTFCFQLMHAADGSGPQITDVNPRPGAATRMSIVCGFDVVSAALADAGGRDPAPYLTWPGGERLVVRHWEEDVRG